MSASMSPSFHFRFLTFLLRPSARLFSQDQDFIFVLEDYVRGGSVVRALAHDWKVASNNSGQVVHTHVPLSPSSIIWYRQKGSWEGNRRSGVALAMRHRLSGLSTYGLNADVWEMSTLPKPHWGTAPLPLPLLHQCITICFVAVTECADGVGCLCGVKAGGACRWFPPRCQHCSDG